MLCDGRSLFWEYPRQTPEGDQIDIAEVVEIVDVHIWRRRIYGGWVGVHRPNHADGPGGRGQGRQHVACRRDQSAWCSSIPCGVYRPRDLSKKRPPEARTEFFEERGCGFGLDHEPLPKLWEVAQLLTHEYRERRRSFEEWGWQPGLLNACSTTWASVLTDVWKPSQSIEYVIVQYLWWKDEAVHRAGMG